MRVAIIGASGSLGRALSEVEASFGSQLLLIASDIRDLERLRSDLTLRFGIGVEIKAIDFSDLNEVLKIDSSLDRYYFPIGLSESDDRLGLSGEKCARLLKINSTHVCALVSEIMAKRASGTLPASKPDTHHPLETVFFGSIAETRGRSQNIFYSMAKRSLTCFTESLLHIGDAGGIRPFLFQMGYLESQQSFGKKLLFPIAKASATAKAVVQTVNSCEPAIRYYPKFWFFVCAVLRNLPWFIYRRLQF